MRLGLRHVDETGTLSGDVAYYRVGPPVNDDAHVTVVFVHGFTLSAGAFFLQVEHLAEQFPDVTSLLFDVRGHGSSPATAEQCTIDGAADDCMELINNHAPRGKVVLVGHSLGGMIALNVIRRAPQELRSRIAGVLLISTAIESLASQGFPQVLASPVANKIHNAIETAPEEVQEFRDDVAALLAPALAATVFHQDDVPYKVVKFHAQMIQNTPLETMVGYFDDLTEHDELQAAPALAGVPGVCIVGDKDHFTPPGQTEMIAQAWPGSTMDVCADVGHMLILEAPDAVNAHLDRLIRNAQQPGTVPLATPTSTGAQTGPSTQSGWNRSRGIRRARQVFVVQRLRGIDAFYRLRHSRGWTALERLEKFGRIGTLARRAKQETMSRFLPAENKTSKTGEAGKTSANSETGKAGRSEQNQQHQHGQQD